jgi:hypothetical protein
MTDANTNIRERINALYDLAYDTNDAIQDITHVIFGNTPGQDEVPEPKQAAYGMTGTLLADIEILYGVLQQNLKDLEVIRKTI